MNRSHTWRSTGCPSWVATACALAFFLVAVAPRTAAQAYAGPLYVGALGLPTSSPGAVFEVDRFGAVSTVVTIPGVGPNAIAVANDNRSLLIGSLFGPGLVEVDPNARTVVRTINVGSLSTITWMTPMESGAIMLTGAAGSVPGVFRFDPLSGVTSTLRSGGLLQQPNALIHDLVTGDYLVGDFGSRSIHRLAKDGALVTTWSVSPAQPLSMAQDHFDGRLLLGSTFAQIFTFQPKNGTLLRFGAVPNPNALAFDRDGPAPVICGASGPVVRFSRMGSIATTLFTMPAGYAATGMCFASERNIVTTRLGGQSAWRFDLDFAGEAGRPYYFALSLSGFTPGVTIDSRRLPLNFDVLVAASVFGTLGPILSGTTGVLDGAGRASAWLDLRGIPAPLPGIPVWGCALTVDGNAPSGIATISKPVVVVLR